MGGVTGHDCQRFRMGRCTEKGYKTYNTCVIMHPKLRAKTTPPGTKPSDYTS